MYDVISAEYKGGYKIEVVFENGRCGVVDFSGYPARGGVFARFADMDYFRRFEVNRELGVLTRGADVDIAPETLYAKATWCADGRNIRLQAAYGQESAPGT